MLKHEDVGVGYMFKSVLVQHRESIENIWKSKQARFETANE